MAISDKDAAPNRSTDTAMASSNNDIAATGRAGTTGAAGAGSSNAEMDLARFRQHFDANYGASGNTYEDYDPAYRYGHELGRNDEYRGQDWTRIAPHARKEWEGRNPAQESTWERFKDAIRHGWESVTGQS